MMRKSVSSHKGEKITYWRSIENRKRTAEYIESIEDEFMGEISEITSMDRRSMLKVMGASAALAGLGVSCRRPVEKILPYVHRPEDVVPGIPNFYATAQPTPFCVEPLLVESHEGRPTKVEGNPSHPESLGKASFINQASVLELYDPDRSRFVTKSTPGGRVPAEWTDWDTFAAQHFSEVRKAAGEGLAVVMSSDLSPTMLALKKEFKNKSPKAAFFTHEPMRQRNVEDAAAKAFGDKSRVRYHLENASIIACLFADPFSFGPEQIRHTHGLAKNRQVHSVEDAKKMNRLYTVEADFGLAGTNADHRMRLPVSMAKKLVLGLAYELLATQGLDVDPKIPGSKTLSALVTKPPNIKGIDKKFLYVMAEDLAKNAGRSVIIGGDHVHKDVLALIHVLNVALKGHTRVFDVVTIDDDSWQHLKEPGLDELTKDLKAKKVSTLVFLGVNPAYDTPGALNFGSFIEHAKVSVHSGMVEDETAKLCSWHLPMAHFLEQFGDGRSFDGTISIIQPLIRPLHAARSLQEIMTVMADVVEKNPLNQVKETFKNQFGLFAQKNFDKAVHDGFVAGSAFKVRTSLQLSCESTYKDFGAVEAKEPSGDQFELVINFDRRVLDGRYANNAWVQELPDPVTKINWGNALFISPLSARALKIKSRLYKRKYEGDLVSLSVDGHKQSFPVFVVPGLADNTLVASLGYGRASAGEVGSGVGYDAYKLLTHLNQRVLSGITLKRLEAIEYISTTQEQFAMNGDVVQEVDVLELEGRDPARDGTVAEFIKDPGAAKHKGILEDLLVEEKGKKEKVPLQITEGWDYTKGNQWGMVIDLTRCTGCNACITACQSENNIPVVGKEQVMRGRMMHWIRVDRYFVGDVKNPRAISQPMPCQHCENAPCEPVCPVAATVHDKEGLNGMVYNRCIGTRYCANNCPYKVRRFNYFDFTHTGNVYVDKHTEERQKTIKLQRNPDVTVRYRGVMEKCTFCTQRIQEAKIAARRNAQDYNNLPDGAVTPACAQTCPAEAIVFGNINDPDSRVSKLKGLGRNYSLLEILNSRPRTTYLSKIRNPHPKLVA